jgi:KaiC/GvpD/RAD55 family RecA-like ATPase
VTNPQSDLRHLYDLEVEALILGGILRAGDRALEQVRYLSPDDFTLQANRTIFSAILELEGEIGIGLDSVAHRLDETGQLEGVGGLAMLVDLDQRAIPGLSLQHFADKLRAKARGREAVRRVAKLNLLLEGGAFVDGEEARGEIEELLALSESGSGDRRNRIEGLPNPEDSEEPVSYIIEPELPAGAVVALTGDSGSGKSSLATAWARNAIAAGRPVLILDRENPRSVVTDRMKRLGLSGGPLLRWWGGWLRSEAPEPGVASVYDWVKSWVAQGLPPLLIADSLAAFNVGDENNAADMRRFMHQCRRLADLGATVLVIHHDGKADSARDFRGSSDFKASVDQAFHCSNLSSDGKLDRLTLRCFKSRYGLSGSFIYRYAAGRFVRDERRDAPVRSVADQLTAILHQRPGIGSKKFEEEASKQGLGRQQARDFLTNGVLSGVIRRESAGRNRLRHYLQGEE